jgi:anti-sigma regulatory factor (Ser/Thr protein kinase)
MRWTLRAGPHAPAAARAQVSDYLAKPDVSDDVAADVVLAVSELVTNAIEAGASEIEIGVDVGRHQVTVSVDDDTSGWPRPTVASPVASRGRGLAIVAQMSHSWHAERTATGKKITASFINP